MTSAPSLAIGSAVLLAALAGATAMDSFYRVEIRDRRPDILESAEGAGAGIDAEGAAPTLALRLVDSGGVGIPSADWGADYSHDARAFREVILQDPPFVNAEALRRVDRDWRIYVNRMRDDGNNGIVVPLFLPLVDFSRVNGPAIYGADTTYPARHAAVRRHFGPMFEWAAGRGMPVYLSTDMLALTPPLHQHLRRLAPAASAVGVDVSNPAVWQIYSAAFAELFDALPSIQGVVIRIGEGGPLYNSPGWPYRSEVAVRDAAGVRAMLEGLLPVFESRGKLLVLRTWTVGVGRLGRLHVDQGVYDSVLGDIDSPALVVSTKFTAGDFFSHLPLNPTLSTGRHRRLVELQARPEFEGFGAFPDFLGHEHASALRALTRANPRIAGTLLWTQSGGPLRAGPRSLYPFTGSWTWIDANVFVASRLATNPGADVDDLARISGSHDLRRRPAHHRSWCANS